MPMPMHPGYHVDMSQQKPDMMGRNSGLQQAPVMHPQNTDYAPSKHRLLTPQAPTTQTQQHPSGNVYHINLNQPGLQQPPQNQQITIEKIQQVLTQIQKYEK